MRAVIRLSSVCRTWRLAAHSLGFLWKHIDYSLWGPSVEDIFKCFLERSSYYLNVRVEIDFEETRRTSTTPRYFRCRTFHSTASGRLSFMYFPVICFISIITRGTGTGAEIIPCHIPPLAAEATSLGSVRHNIVPSAILEGAASLLELLFGVPFPELDWLLLFSFLGLGQSTLIYPSPP
jgi:hypothetical protein